MKAESTFIYKNEEYDREDLERLIDIQSSLCEEISKHRLDRENLINKIKLLEQQIKILTHRYET